MCGKKILDAVHVLPEYMYELLLSNFENGLVAIRKESL
jgi:hypothetical protein